jgi:hypothetical protein
MKKVIGFLVIMTFTISTIVFAATEIEKITFDLANQDAQIVSQTGDFVLSNSVIANGDTITTNSFKPNGGYLTAEVRQPAFSQIVGGLLQVKAVNIDAITNSTMGETGDYIAQEDSNVVADYPVNAQANGT